MSPQLKVFRGDGIYKSESEKKRERELEAIRREEARDYKQEILDGIEEVRFWDATIIFVPAHFSKNLARKHEALGVLFKRLGEVSDSIYEDFVLSGEVFRLLEDNLIR